MSGQSSALFSFQDARAQPLTGGQVQIHLSRDASLGTAGGPSVSTRTISATLDSTGSATVLLWPNDLLLPSGTVYFVNAFSMLGEPAWTGQTTVHS